MGGVWGEPTLTGTPRFLCQIAGLEQQLLDAEKLLKKWEQQAADEQQRLDKLVRNSLRLPLLGPAFTRESSRGAKGRRRRWKQHPKNRQTKEGQPKKRTLSWTLLFFAEGVQVRGQPAFGWDFRIGACG